MFSLVILPNNYVFVTAGGFVDINGKTACFDVGVTEFISNIDAPAASIGDYVWLDKNRNGIIDTGATGIPNVTVTLYKSDGSSTGLSAMTDQDGYYKINGIPPGSYYVVFSGVPTDYEFITANGLVDSSGKSPEFTLTGGQINNTIDAPVAPIRGSIGDLVWNDVNGNGQLDDGEVGVPGVTVTLYNCYDDGTLVLPNPSYTTITDSNGKYTIDNIEPGEYYVIFTTLPPDYNFITAGDYVDKNGKSNCFTINPASNLTNIDAPIAQNPTPASITGLVWNDINRDNIVDSGENGVPGVTVTLYNCDGNPTGLSTTTNTDGTYTIANIQPGSYYVVFRNLPDDYEFVSGIYVNSQGRNPSNSSECIILGDGEIKTDVNAPIAEALTPLASIGDLVWYDLNRDGEYNPGETGVPGVIVTLFYSNGNPTGLSAVTNAAGIYAINNIQPGEYYVIFSNIPNKYDFVVTENSFIDSTGRSDNFTLISNEVNNTIDAPIAPQYATIGDKIIYDTNRNGARDPGELGVPNVLVTLYDCTDVDAENPLATAITNSNGIYSIDNIEPGEYYVIFSEIPTDYVFITTNNYTNEKGISSCFDLQPGEINNRIDAFIAIDTPRSAQVGDFIWYDKNRNGIIDANERGVSGVTATLYKADTDELIDITSTNISGIYGITGIPAGQYYVKFSDIPPGYRFFYESGLVDETGRSNVFTLKDGDIIDYVDAPIVEQEGSVSGFAWNDVNNDGVKQNNENNVEGIVVTLYTCTGEKTNYSAITDSNGNYFISNLVPGQYRAVFSNIPSNYKFVTAGDYVTSTGVTPTCFTVSPNETTTNINSPISLPYTPVVIPYTRYNAQFLNTCSRVICSNNSIIFDFIDISLNNPYIISEQSLNIFRLLHGIYLINYSASVKSNSIYGIDNIKLGICVDGNIIMGSESHTTIGQAGTGNLFGTIIINLNSASLIGLYNLSTHPINVLQSTMTVVKIS